MNKKVIDLKSKGSSISVTGPIQNTDESYPFNAANRQYLPFDLAAHGYVEEEFLVSGLANVYEWSRKDTSQATVRTAGAPYTTRILVRRPADVSRFSGNVIVEPFNWAWGYDKPWGAWAESHDYFLSRSYAWVGVTVRPAAVAGLKAFNPARYALLSFANPLPPGKTCPNPGFYPTRSSPLTEDGLAWDIFSHVGALIKSNDLLSPLAGYKVEYVFASGATGGDLSAYVSAIHPLATLDSGRPIYDGYIIKCTGSPGSINQCEPKLLPDDPRCKLHANVPVIRVQTQSDILGEGLHPDWSYLQRRPDSDDPGDRFRLYEVAGSSIQATYPLLSNPCKENVIAAGAEWKDNFAVPRETPEYEFPLRYIINSAFANLDLWVRRGTPPPRADRMSTNGEYPSMSFVLDDYGNIRGGIRTPYVEVPTATYNSDGTVIPFDNKLLKNLYPSHVGYVNEVVTRVDVLLRQRWLTEADARAIKQQAERASVP